MTNSAKFDAKYLVKVFIMLFLMLGFKYIPPFGGITPVGMEIIGLLFGTVFGWVNFNFIMPTMLCLVFLGSTECYTTINDLFTASFANANAIVILGICILSGWLLSLGLCDVIAKFMTTRNFLKGRPWLSVSMFIFAMFITAVMTNSMAAALIFIYILMAQAEALNFKSNKKLTAIYLGGICLAATLSELPLPVKGCAYIYISLYETFSGNTVDLMQYTILMLPACVILLLAYILLARFVIRPDVSMLQDTSILEAPTVSRQQKWALWAFVVLIFLLMAPTYLPKSIPGVTWITSIGTGGTCFLFLGIISFIRIDGEPLLNIRSVMPSVALDPWFLILGLMPLANCLTADITGIKPFLVGCVEPFLANMTPYIAVAFIIIATTIITQIANNMIVAVSFMTVAFTALAIYPNISMVVVFCMISLAAHISMVLPSANPVAAIVYAQTELTDFKSLFKVMLPANVVLILITATLLYAYGTFIF